MVFGQSMGTYEARCVGVSTFLTGDEGGAGLPDVTWLLKMEFLGSGFATITELPEQCFHRDEVAPLVNYNPGSWYLSTGLYPATPCHTKVYFRFTMSGFEKDPNFFNDNCAYQTFDDYGRIYTVRQGIGARVDQPNIWYPHEFIIEAQNGDPLYKFKFEFKYSIDVMNGAVTEAYYGGSPGLPSVVCENDFYELRARTFSGNNGYFEWQRRPVGSSTWSPYTKGYGLREISVQASNPGYYYQVRVISNNLHNCLADNDWQQSPAPPNIIKRAPYFYEIWAFTRPTCDAASNGTVILFHQFTPSGLYDVLLQSQSDPNQVLEVENTTFPVTFNGLDSGYYTAIITRPGGGDTLGGQCTSFKEDILVRSVNIPTPQSVTVGRNETCFGANDGYIRVVTAVNPNPYFERDTVTLTGPVTRVRRSYGYPITFGSLPPGTYNVVVTRAAQYNQNSCSSASITRTVTGVSAPLSANIVHTNPSCAGELGSITVFGITGGTPFSDGTYNIQYGGRQPERVSSSKLYNDLYPRPYIIRITDANNCLLTLNADIIPPPSTPSVSLSGQDATACMPNGNIKATGSGGAPPYQYSLDEMIWQSSDSFPNLPPGYYRVYMRDDSLCTANAGTYINSSIGISLFAFQSGNTCADSATAQITTDQSGGNTTSDYTIELYKLPDTTNPVQTMISSANTLFWNDLSAGAYLVRLTDIDGCTAESSLVVQELAAAYFTSVETPSPECFDDDLPPITIEVAGRSAPISPVTNLEVSIDGGSFQSTTLILDNGATAIHEFTPATIDGDFVVRDDLGCPIDTMRVFDRIEPDTVLVEVLSVDSVSCDGLSDGSMTFKITGAIKPYKAQLYIESVYGNEWVAELLTNEDTLTFSNLRASVAEFQNEPYFGWEGGYFLRVTDNINNPGIECITSSQNYPSTSLHAPSELDVTGVAQALLLDCRGQGGSIMASATGGTGPYEFSLDAYTWQSNPLLNGAIDSNFVFVRDSRDCREVTSSLIHIGFAPIPIVVNSIITSPGSECLPQRDSVVLDGIDQGFYINGFDVLWNNCTGDTIPATSNEKDLINIISIGSNYLVVENLIQNIIPAGCDTVVEGIMLFNLTDSNTCNADIAVPIKVKNRLPRLTVTSKTGVTCSGDTDGSITVRVVDSLFDAGDAGSMKLSPPFAVTLNNETPQVVTTFPYEITFNGIPESGFTISVEGSRDCASAIIDSIGRLSPYDLTIVNSSVTGCGTDSTGGLSVTVNGGSNLPYTWTWYSDADMAFVPYGPAEILNLGQTTTLNNLPVTTVRAIIQDANTCADTLDFAIQGPNILAMLKIDSTNLLCNNDGSGIIAVNSLGGTLPVQYSIDGMAPQADSVFTGLTAGIHDVQAIDANGCIDSVQFNLEEPPEIMVNDVSITEVTCFGESDGMIGIMASGGRGNLQYAINAGPFQGSGIFTGLSTGMYSITIRDDSMCTRDTMNILVPEPTQIATSFTIIDSLTCVQNAALAVVVGGGIPGYTYNWDGGISMTDTLNNAGEGQHIIEIMDSRGCIHRDTIVLSIPNSPVLSLVADTAEACRQIDGSFEVMASSGVPPYTYNVGGSVNTIGYFSGLASGSYEVVVTDVNGCLDTLDVQVDSVGSPIITQIDTTQTRCIADDGSITLTVGGGTPPFTYSWSHNIGLNSPIALGLGVGTYGVTISDARLCEITASIDVTEKESPELAVVQEVNSACGQDDGMAIVSATGGTPGYVFSWSHDGSIIGPLASNLAPATYLVIVTDINGCSDSVNVIIGEDPPPVLSVVDNADETCGLSNGFITVTALNGMRPYIYTWSHTASILDSTATNLPAGTYTIIVEDANNCRDTIMVNLGNTPGPNVSLVESRDNQCPDAEWLHS